MTIRAVAAILISSGKPIRASAVFVAAAVAVSCSSITATAVPVHPIKAEFYIPAVMPLVSQVTATDTTRVHIGKVLVDVVSTLDEVTIAFVRPLTDSVTAFDEASFSTEKALSDTVAATDTLAIHTDQGTIEDSVTTSDTATVSLRHSGAWNEVMINGAQINGTHTG